MKTRWVMGPLMDAAPAAGGGDAKAITADDVTALITKSQEDFAKKLPTLFKDLNKGTTDALTTLTASLTAISTKLDAAQPVPDDPNKGKGKGKEGDDDVPPALKAQLLALQKRTDEAEKKIKASEDKATAAEAKARAQAKESAIRKELGVFEFASPDAADDLFTLINGKADYDDEGNILGDGLPLTDFVKGVVEKKPHFLAPLAKGGSGANGGNRLPGGAKVQMEDLTPAKLMADPKLAQRAAGQIVQRLREGGMQF